MSRETEREREVERYKVKLKESWHSVGKREREEAAHDWSFVCLLCNRAKCKFNNSNNNNDSSCTTNRGKKKKCQQQQKLQTPMQITKVVSSVRIAKRGGIEL